MDSSAAHTAFEAMWNATRKVNVDVFTSSLATHTRAAACVQKYDGLLRTTRHQIRNQLVTTWNLQDTLEQVVNHEADPSCGGAIVSPDCAQIGATNAYCQLVVQHVITCHSISDLMVFAGIEVDDSASTGPSAHDTIVASHATPHQHSRQRNVITLGIAATVAVRNLANDQSHVERWIDAQRANNVDMAAGIAKLHEAQRLHLMSVYGPDEYKRTAVWLNGMANKAGKTLLNETKQQYNPVEAGLLFTRLEHLSSAATAAVEKLGPDYRDLHTPLK
jgi:hypothetical protein